MNCPLCNRKVTYEGFLKVECGTPTCENWDKETNKPVALPQTLEEWQAYLNQMTFPWPGITLHARRLEFGALVAEALVCVASSNRMQAQALPFYFTELNDSSYYNQTDAINQALVNELRRKCGLP